MWCYKSIYFIIKYMRLVCDMFVCVCVHPRYVLHPYITTSRRRSCSKDHYYYYCHQAAASLLLLSPLSSSLSLSVSLCDDNEKIVKLSYRRSLVLAIIYMENHLLHSPYFRLKSHFCFCHTDSRQEDRCQQTLTHTSHNERAFYCFVKIVNQ